MKVTQNPACDAGWGKEIRQQAYIGFTTFNILPFSGLSVRYFTNARKII